MTGPVLEARDLVRVYPARVARTSRAAVRALDGVSLAVAPGETLGLVGESGCGKSTLGRIVAGLDAPTSGTVTFEGQPVRAARPDRTLRRRLQVVFQDPYSALDPRQTIGASIAEGLEIHRLLPRAGVPARVAALMAEVGLDPAQAGAFPHQCSGGQRQRVGIARALAVAPALLVLDEPVSALDVSVQAQVLNLLADLQAARGLAYLFIAHDLAVVRQLAHRIAVMYLGRIVEVGTAAEVTATPAHPYTRALRAAAPVPDPAHRPPRVALASEPAGSDRPATGCAYAPRCDHPGKDARCLAERPTLRAVGPALVACHHAEES